MTEPGKPRGTDDRRERLSRTLRRVFRSWARGEEPWRAGRIDFAETALRAFRVQYRGNSVYRRYCEARGVGPETVQTWTDVPAVPTAAFRSVELVTGSRGNRPLVFRTSGTTRGAANRGIHVIPDPELYRASLEAGFRRNVLEAPGLAPFRRARICSLIPSFADSDASSLSWMVDAVLERFGAADSVVAADGGGLDLEAATRAADAAAGSDTPVVVLATTLALDEWTRRLAAAGRRLALPEGSRIMDTGGAKGREGLDRGDVLERTAGRLGVGPEGVVNEFGMTELASQRYSRPRRHAGTTGEGAHPPEAPVLRAPPWLRTRVLDPRTLEPRPAGEVGILCHFDLANLGSVCAVLTEDRGRARRGGIQWVGRSTGAPPRGCSLATAELLRRA